MKHEIVLFYNSGETVVASCAFDKLFSREAFRWFDREAYTHFPAMYPVSDSTIAGFHYRNADGSVVLELR